MKFTIDELKYLRNLIVSSGDMGYRWKIGDMKEMIDCYKLESKIREIICQKLV